MTLLERLRPGIATASAEDMRALAAQLARELPVDVTLALHGDLGVGKTTFVQGLAHGFGITAPVTSPTFNIYSVHRAPGCMLVHLDAYRLETGTEADDLLLEDFLVSPWCLAVEWPERIAGWIPPDAWHLEFAIRPDETHTVRLR